MAETDMTDLKARVLSAVRWSAGIFVFSRLLSLTRTLFIARLLGPAELGLFGAAAIVVGIAETISHPGFQPALVQSKTVEDRALHTAWTLQAGRGLLISAGLLLVAPIIAGVIGDGRVVPLVRALAVCTLLSGLVNIGIVHLERELDYRRQFYLSVVASLVDVGASLLALAITRSVWALIVGTVAGSATRLALSYVVHPFRPRPALDFSAARRLLAYGKWISASGTMILAIENLDDLSAAFFLGTSALGIYQMAYRIINLPATEIMGPVAGIAFPTYSRLWDDPAMLRRAFQRMTLGVLGVAVPATVWLMLYFDPLARMILGPEWTQIAPLGRILGVFVLARLLGWSLGALFQAVGRPDYVGKITAVHLSALVPALVLLVPRWGIVGLAWAVVLPILLSQMLGWWLVSRRQLIPISEIGRVIGQPVLLALLAGGVAAVVGWYLDAGPTLILGSIVFWAAYAVAFELVSARSGSVGLRSMIADLLTRPAALRSG